MKLYCKNKHFFLSGYFHIRSFLYAIWVSNWVDFRFKNHPKSPFGGLPGRLWASCGRLGGVLGRLGGLLAPSCRVQEASWTRLGSTWSCLDGIWRPSDAREAAGRGGPPHGDHWLPPCAPVLGIHLYIRLVCTRAFKTHGFLLCLDVGYEFRLVDFGWWI